jgi:effector-binding domain-containing protein
MLLPSRKVMATLCRDNPEYIFYAYRNAMVWFSMNGIRVPGNGFELYFFSVDMDRKTVDNSIAFPMEMCFSI